MARVLIYTSPGIGHLSPALGVAEELLAQAHKVCVICLADKVDAVQAKAMTARAMDARIEQVVMNDYLASNPIDAVKRAIGVFARRAPYEVEDLQSGIKAFKPDFLLIDTNSFGARMAAESSGLPWVCFQPFLSPLPAHGVPPFGPGLKPMKGPLGHARDALLGRLITGTLERLSLNAVNPVRKELGLAPLADYEAFHTCPPRTLYFTTDAFDYVRDSWPDSFVMCGPVHERTRVERPQWLQNESRPIVLVTCSSELQDDRRIIDSALDGLNDTDWLVVATSAAHDPAGFKLPDNARVERFAPHDLLLDQAAAVICHGGMGITQKALSKSVPVCVIPYGRDQLEVARRVESAKAGIYLTPKKLKPTVLRQATFDTIRNKPGAESIAASFRQAGGAKRAVQVITTGW